MIILTLRTDKPEAEIGLYDGQMQLAYKTWMAHRQLAETLHRSLEKLLSAHSKVWADIEGIVCFQGPGSFTGLRIGLTVGNTLAYSYGVPIVAMQGSDWIKEGIQHLCNGENQAVVVPFYGAEVHITPQKK